MIEPSHNKKRVKIRWLNSHLTMKSSQTTGIRNNSNRETLICPFMAVRQPNTLTLFYLIVWFFCLMRLLAM